MWGSRSRQSILALVFFAAVQALQVTSNSDCEALCTDTSADSDSATTNSTDIVCEDNEFSKTGKGIKYKNCLNCLQNSNATHGEESDVFSFLYNVRYAFDVCIFSYPAAAASGTVNSPCNIDGACAPLGKALETSLVNATTDNRFDYCGASDSIISSESYSACITCLQSTNSQTYFSNFLVALRAGCEQRPDVGDLIGLSGTIFTSSAVNITNTTASTALPGDGGAAVGTMTTGTIVGIAVGCVLIFIGAFGLLFIYFRKKRRVGLKIDSPPPDAPMNGGQFIGNRHITNQRQQTTEALPTYNNKHILSHNREVSNAQFYDKLEADRAQAMNYYQIPPARGFGLQTSLPAHPAYMPQVLSRSAAPPTRNSYVLESYDPSVARPKIDFNFATLNSVPTNAIPSNVVTQDTGIAVDSRSSSRQEFIQPPPPPPPPAALKVPSLALPSLAKFKMPKKYVPPNVLGPGELSPMAERKEPTQSELAISKPLAVLEARFPDKPLQGGQVLATEAPEYFAKNNRATHQKSPLMSGNTITTVKSDDTRVLW